MPGGRPSTYDTAYCDRVIEWGKQGKSRTWIAATIGVVKNTLTAWEAEHPEFLTAMGLASQFSQLWWENIGQDNLTNTPFQASMWSRSMAARFPDDWREKVTQEHTGKDGGAIQTEELSGRDLARRIALALAQAK